MLDYLLLTLMLGMATNRVVEVWWHSVIMSWPRLLFKYEFIKFPFSDAALCPYCFSHHVAAALTVVAFLGLSLNWWLFPLVWLGAVYTANALNDNLKSKTPKANYEEDIALAASKENG